MNKTLEISICVVAIAASFFAFLLLIFAFVAMLKAPETFAKQELYRQKTGQEIGFWMAFGMPFEACIPSEADKTYNINLGSAKKEK